MKKRKISILGDSISTFAGYTPVEAVFYDSYVQWETGVKSVEDTEVIKITVTNENAAYSAKIANEIAKIFSNMVSEIYNINNIYIVDDAEVSDTPSNIHHSKDVVIFGFLGIVIAVMYVLIANMLDTTIKTPEDIEKGVGLPVLVTIPYIENFGVEKGGKRK